MNWTKISIRELKKLPPEAAEKMIRMALKELAMARSGGETEKTAKRGRRLSHVVRATVKAWDK